jgi:hypothetical protein
MPGTVTIGGILEQLQMGTPVTIGPYTITPNAAGNFALTSIQLVNGANTITVPSWATGCIINPNSANAVAMTLKGVTGDTGIPLDLTSPSLLNFPAAPPASFVLTSASAGATQTEILFF